MKVFIRRGLHLSIFTVVILGLVLAITGCSNDNITSVSNPVIISFSPSDVSLGEIGAGTITGTNFGGVTSVTMGDGIQVTQFSAVNSAQINVQFAVSNTALPGPRSITVQTANGSATANSIFTVIGDHAPVAHFRFSPANGDENTVFTFDGSASTPQNNITDYAWNFGDGTNGDGMIVQHMFQNGGTYGVQLTVTDAQGRIAAAEKNLTVSNFDIEGAIKQVRSLLIQFFERYSHMQTLSSAYIVEGWAIDCPAREHEIKIIDGQRQIFLSNDADVLGTINVTFSPDHQEAKAPVTARFDWTTLDNVQHTAVCTHFFDLAFEDGIFQVCNFTVTCDSAAATALFSGSPQ